jgi:glycosyltransferase involved in cell wall biosynthesis
MGNPNPGSPPWRLYITATFDSDPFPGKPKILFVGLADSSHTHAWINLLDEAVFNVRLFGTSSSYPPVDWPIKTYVSGIPSGSKNLLRRYLFSGAAGKLRQIYQIGARKLGLPSIFPTSESWLADIIYKWKPDIIHTLGIFDLQGGQFYFGVRRKWKIKKIGKWIIQIRGGPDTALRRYNPEIAREILGMLQECDQIIADNYGNLEYIKSLGVGNKIASIAPVPGSGGINIDVNRQNHVQPSTRKRIIYWPKAYESMPSKALPVLEAIKLAWAKIKPCVIYMTAVDQETEAWVATLPEEIRENCHIYQRVPRDQALDIMKKARVMLAPSLLDGVPNVLYESMALGAFPIVSPLESITPIVKPDENVLFARNLFPDEIASALIRSMKDDVLVDTAAFNNKNLVAKIANRQTIKPQVVQFYTTLASHQTL